MRRRSQRPTERTYLAPENHSPSSASGFKRLATGASCGATSWDCSEKSLQGETRSFRRKSYNEEPSPREISMSVTLLPARSASEKPEVLMTTLQRRSKIRNANCHERPCADLSNSRECAASSFQEYRDDIRELYDGPRGAVLAAGQPRLAARAADRPRAASPQSSTSPAVGGFSMWARARGKFSGISSSKRCRTRSWWRSTCRIRCFAARSRVKNSRPRYIAGDMMRMPFADGTFDCVTCGWVIEHLPDPRPGLAGNRPRAAARSAGADSGDRRHRLGRFRQPHLEVPHL